MTWNTFLRSAIFAAVAAVGWLVWTPLAAPVVGAWGGLPIYLTGVTAAYIAGLHPTRGRGVVVAAVAAVAAGLVVFAARTTSELTIALAAVLGVARSGFLYRSSPARAVAGEAVLLAGGLLFARSLGGFSPPSTALAIWGFLLVQSLFFLVPAVRPRLVGGRQADGFEEAHRRALALLERTGV